MKKTVSIALLVVFVWGCSHKMTPAVGGASASGSSSSSNSVAPATMPSVKLEGTSAVAAASAIIPNDKTGTKIPVTDATKVASAEMLGQSTFNAKCGRCHGLKVTTDYTADRWVSIIQIMAMRAQLNDAEKENVLAYVKANAKK